MSVLLIAEHNNKELRPFTYNAVSAASKIDEDLHILVLGNKSEAVAKSASEIPNVKKIKSRYKMSSSITSLNLVAANSSTLKYAPPSCILLAILVVLSYLW